MIHIYIIYVTHIVWVITKNKTILNINRIHIINNVFVTVWRDRSAYLI